MPMKDEEFAELKIKATICPEAIRWPTEYTHWKKLHGAVNEARDCTARALRAMDEVDQNADLSAEGRIKERTRIAERAISDFGKSSALSDAQAAVSNMQTKWAAKVAEIIKAPEDPRDVAIHAQVRDRVANMSKEDRFKFLQQHGDDLLVASALLTAPPFISGLSEAETALIRSKMERIALAPEVLEAKDAVTKAMASAERGWRAAMALIAGRGKIVPERKGLKAVA